MAPRLDPTEQRIRVFEQRYGRQATHLAAHAAFPLTLTTDVVYCLRETYLPDCPWYAAADLLLSGLCLPVGYDLYEMEPPTRRYLLSYLRDQFGHHRVRDLERFMVAYLRHRLDQEDSDRPLVLGDQPQWTVLACLSPGDAFEEIRQNLQQLAAQAKDPKERFRLASVVENYGEFLADRQFQPLLLDMADRVAAAEPIDDAAALTDEWVKAGLQVTQVLIEVATIWVGEVDSPSQDSQLQEFRAETVTVNSRGEIIAREPVSAFWFSEVIAPSQRALAEINAPEIPPTLSGDNSLSVEARVALSEALAKLPDPQFKRLVFALNPPPGILPADQSALGDRAASFLQWAENNGPGLAVLQQALAQITGPAIAPPVPPAPTTPQPTPTGSIFISYRRDDSASDTGRIYDRLAQEFGRDNIFKDVDSIPFGVDFAQHIDQAVGRCQVLLAVIGKAWLTPRLQNPDDFVRLEIESALNRGIPVVPVFLEGVTGPPPRDQLPESLQPLIRRNGTQVGHDPRFHADMGRLVKGLQDYFRQPSHPVQPPISAVGVSRAVVDGNVAPGPELIMVAIRGGELIMGSPEDEADRDWYSNVFPETDGINVEAQHRVRVPSFFIAQYPITQVQWRAVAALPMVAKQLDPDPSNFKGDNHPVENVFWYEAVEFCDRLSALTGREYRLPSEAEWEYACRAGSTTPFYFGETITTDLANYDGSYSYSSGPKGTYRETTTIVGSFAPNGFGLYDMHGNVYEWCQDHWHPSYEGAPSDGSAWVTGGDKGYRLVRGGSWYYDPVDCRSANRYRYVPNDRSDSIGFRVVCAPPGLL